MALSFIRAGVSPRRNSLLRFFANVSTMKVIYVRSYSPSFLVVEEARLILETKKRDIFVGFWKIVRALTNIPDAICRLSARVQSISSTNANFFLPSVANDNINDRTLIIVILT